MNAHTPRNEFVKRLVAAVGVSLNDEQLKRRIAAARQELLDAIPKAAGTIYFFVEQRLVPEAGGLYLKMALRQRPQQILFPADGEAPSEPPRLREEAIRRCGDIHAAVDGTLPVDPVERGAVQGALKRLDGTTIPMGFPDGELELGYPAAPLPHAEYQDVTLSGRVIAVEQDRLRLESPVLSEFDIERGSAKPSCAFARRLLVNLPRGGSTNAEVRIAAVHAMNAHERLQLRAIAIVLPDDDLIREAQFTELVAQCPNSASPATAGDRSEKQTNRDGPAC